MLRDEWGKPEGMGILLEVRNENCETPGILPDMSTERYTQQPQQDVNRSDNDRD
jgi:hypothetical protein